MTGKSQPVADLAKVRALANLTQTEAAERLAVSQPFLSMLESGKKQPSETMLAKMRSVYALPPTYLPLELPAPSAAWFFQQELGSLGYPGFAYLAAKPTTNPAALLLAALDQEDLDQRVVEGLPWLPLSFSTMNWDWLVPQAKLRDRQNRLGFVVALAAELASDEEVRERLWSVARQLERSRLAADDTLCYDSMNETQRAAVKRKRTPLAAQWKLLTDLSAERLVHVVQ
jgi:transcriptional regulator with XRE-family HTH domain